MELTNQESKRIYALNDKAVKSAKSAMTDLQAAAAAGMYKLMHGHKEFINDLYRKLATEVPAMADSLRRFYAPEVINKFGKGGILNPLDPNDPENRTWAKRPDAFFTFSGRDAGDGKPGFSLVDVKSNTDLTPQQIANIKAARKAIRDGEESALNFQWKSPERERREAEAMDESGAAKAVASLLRRLASNAATNHYSMDDIRKIGAAAKLGADAIGKALEAYPKAETTSNGTGEIKPQETLIKTVKAEETTEDDEEMIVPPKANKPEIHETANA